MRTNELITALVADTGPTQPHLHERLLRLLMTGVAGSVILFLAVLGPRDDLLQALATWRFDFKLILACVTAGLALVGTAAMLRPTAPIGWRPAALAVAALALAVAIELASTPAPIWAARLVGSNAAICLTVIPTLAVLPLATLIYALRAGAPASPTGAGALAGFASAAIAASLYATHCTDDSPLFVATWYSLATLLMTAVGAMLGWRLLRW